MYGFFNVGINWETMVEDKPYSYAKDELQDVYVMGKKCHCGHLEEMIEEIKELKEQMEIWLNL